MNTVIKAESLGKKYVLQHEHRERYTALRDVIARNAKGMVRSVVSPFLPEGSINGYKGKREDLWALRNVSFEVKQGETVGIIGRNGAGKSTLLKILSRITEPTEGRVTLKGRVASLLEVGTGFHPELTGRENIYLNGAILGMTKAEIKSKFDEIVDFAEIEKFLDTPVKRYSSGMYVRLAFAVAAHLEPEILLIDEVLAVGDAGFQRKCLGKMGRVAAEGRTILFVSHNIAAIRSICHRAILLQSGQVQDVGTSQEIIFHYIADNVSITQERIWETSGSGFKSGARLYRADVTPLDKNGSKIITVRTPLKFEFAFWNNLEERTPLNFSVHIYNAEGICILNTFSVPEVLTKGLVVGSFIIPRDFLNDGLYTARLLIVKDGSPIIDEREVFAFQVHDDRPEGLAWYGKWEGVVRPHFKWNVEVRQDGDVKQSV